MSGNLDLHNPIACSQPSLAAFYQIELFIFLPVTNYRICCSYLNKLASGPNPDASEGSDLSKPWQESESVLSLVCDDQRLLQKRSQMEAKLESLQSTRKILIKFA